MLSIWGSSGSSRNVSRRLSLTETVVLRRQTCNAVGKRVRILMGLCEAARS
jgi:hypothetical protein